MSASGVVRRLQDRPPEVIVKTALVIGACMILAGTASSAKEAVGIRVSPNISMAPATIRVLVTVEPEDANRELMISADSGEFYTSSTVQLDGNKAPRLQMFTLKELPAGTYQVEARVRLRDGDERRAVADYLVMQ
jgi:hypothetical protein